MKSLRGVAKMVWEGGSGGNSGPFGPVVSVISCGECIASEATLLTRASEATLSALNTKIPTIGQKVMAASFPVVIASDQSAIPVTVFGIGALATEATLSALNGKFGTIGQHAAAGSTSVVIASDQIGTIATQATLAAISAQLPATLGQKTAVNSFATVLASDQINLIASQATLAAIAAQLPATLGQKTMANSLAVVLASDQASIPVTVSGVATAANQATEIADLASIVTNTGHIPTPGTNTMANSTPVTIATDDAVTKAIVPQAAFSTPAAVTATNAATAFGASAAVKGVVVQADSTNLVNVRVGDSGISTTRGIQIIPGKAFFVPCTNANEVYLIAESGSPKVNLFIM